MGMHTKFHYLYKITNKITNQIYFGVHQTDNLEDNYFGSGKYLKFAIKKHGKENFIKDILEYFNSPEEMYRREKEVVNTSVITSDKFYNLNYGGDGGFGHINKDKDKKYYFDPITKEIFYLSKTDSRVLSGELRGNNGGKAWYNDTVNSFFLYSTDPRIETLHKGRITSQHLERRYWYNDGISSYHLPPSDPRTQALKKGRYITKMVGVNDGIKNYNLEINDPRVSSLNKGHINYAKKNITYKWYNDGLKNFQFSPEDIVPPHLNPGLLKNKPRGSWYNNGLVEIIVYENITPPKDFKKGKLPVGNWYNDVQKSYRLVNGDPQISHLIKGRRLSKE